MSIPAEHPVHAIHVIHVIHLIHEIHGLIITMSGLYEILWEDTKYLSLVLLLV